MGEIEFSSKLFSLMQARRFVDKTVKPLMRAMDVKWFIFESRWKTRFLEVGT